VPDEELVKRLSGRTVCDNCQTPYTGREPGTKCEKCGGTLVRRKDDEPEAVRNRLAVYQRQTAPVINWYQNAGARLVSIDAVGTTDAVLNRALNALGR
jgi:adenylate kinase